MGWGPTQSVHQSTVHGSRFRGVWVACLMKKRERAVQGPGPIIDGVRCGRRAMGLHQSVSAAMTFHFLVSDPLFGTFFCTHLHITLILYIFLWGSPSHHTHSPRFHFMIGT